MFYSKRQYGGRGQDPFNLPRLTGTRVSLPSSSLDLRELDPDEQCKKGEGGEEKGVRKAGGRIISLGNK